MIVLSEFNVLQEINNYNHMNYLSILRIAYRLQIGPSGFLIQTISLKPFCFCKTKHGSQIRVGRVIFIILRPWYTNLKHGANTLAW